MKIRHHRLSEAALLGGIALLLCTSTGASAQVIHRNVDELGRVSFSDRAEIPAPIRRPGMSTRNAARVDTAEAARRLADARLQRAQGEGARPGEHDAGAGIGEVNHRYWIRQETLRRDVELALVRWNETRGLPAATR
jgi:hypothetical protein